VQRTSGTDEAVGGPIEWNTVVEDSTAGALFDIANPDRLVASEDGIWLLTVTVVVFGAGTIFEASAYANGSPADRQYQLDWTHNTEDFHVLSAVVPYHLTADEYVTVNCSGGGVYTQTATHFNPPTPPMASFTRVA
jgi:hypothetical protein